LKERPQLTTGLQIESNFLKKLISTITPTALLTRVHFASSRNRIPFSQF
jgi:hypothetical protein